MPCVRPPLPENCRVSQVPMKPLRQTVSTARLAPAPRSTTPVEPARLTNAASRCCPQFSNIADSDNASISWLNYAARCSLSTLRAVVTFDYARLAYGWWLAFTVPVFAGWVSSEWFHLSFTFRYDPPFMDFAWRDGDVTPKPEFRRRLRPFVVDTP